MSKHHGEINRLARKRGKYILFAKVSGHLRRENAEDIVQNAFCKLAAQDVFPDNPAAWLYKVIRNLIADHYRSRRQHRHWEETAKVQMKAEYSDSYLGEQVDAESLQTAVQALPPKEKEVIILHCWNGLTFREIAKKLGMSEHCAYQRYEKGIKILKRMYNLQK